MFCSQHPLVLGAKHVSNPVKRSVNPVVFIGVPGIVTCARQVTFARAPIALCMHFHRLTGWNQKDTTALVFGEFLTLDVRRLCDDPVLTLC